MGEREQETLLSDDTIQEIFNELFSAYRQAIGEYMSTGTNRAKEHNLARTTLNFLGCLDNRQREVIGRWLGDVYLMTCDELAGRLWSEELSRAAWQLLQLTYDRRDDFS